MNNIEKQNTAKAPGPKPFREYAIYKGDEFIMIGTARECAERIGVKPDSIRFYSSPVYRRRMRENGILALALDDEDEEKEQQNG